MSNSVSYDANELFKEAQTRWLRPAEVLFILQNYENYQLAQEPPQRPSSGSLFLLNKRVLRFFRKDGHNWRRRKDNRSIKEAHERLKVGNDEVLNCYYAHGEDDPNFQRRSFWMLDKAFDHIVLVHYRDTTVGARSPEAILPVSPPSMTTPSPESCSSGGFGEVRFEEHGNVKTELCSSDNNEEYFRKLKEQLSLNENDMIETGPLFYENEFTSDLDYVPQGEPAKFMPVAENNVESLSSDDYWALEHRKANLLLLDDPEDYPDANEEFFPSNAELEVYENSLMINDQQDKRPSLSSEELTSVSLPEDTRNFQISVHEHSPYSSANKAETYSISYTQNNSVNIPTPMKFTIRDMTPEWGFASERTKVVIVGVFLCDPSEFEWKCMFGVQEVPLKIIQDGVICCEAPPNNPGKVSICICSNHFCCSEIREFEYRVHPSREIPISRPSETIKSPEELLLLVTWVKMLLSDSIGEQECASNGRNTLSEMLKVDDESWDQVMESILIGSGTAAGTMEWIMEQLLKDQLNKWLFSKREEWYGQDDCSLSRKDSGIIHIISGLGFDWALGPIIACNVSIDFRDINGWTALHWAARFGRENMVVSLVASGASALAVTDPTGQHPVGQTPASIAECYGHIGLAGYLSSVALTTHLSSLSIAENEHSKGSEIAEEEQSVNGFLTENLSYCGDQAVLQNTLAAVRNATQAAARIQSAFRSYSFRKRCARETATPATSDVDEYGMDAIDIEGLSAISRLAFRNAHDRNSAALSIQKKYRGWKGRKDFITMRKKVVKLQAHVRGYQARKMYKVCWATGILEKVILRWRRGRPGLRGFRSDVELIDEAEDEDILKLFRRQKVDKALDEAVSRVLSLLGSSEAQHQYHRMYQRFLQAKAEISQISTSAQPTLMPCNSGMDDEIQRFLDDTICWPTDDISHM